MEDAEVEYMERFYEPELASLYFDRLLKETGWRHETLKLWGKQMPQPRLTAWYGDAGTTYSYSGLRLAPYPWTLLLDQIRQDIQALTGDSFNSVLLNLYRDENDSVSWHSDNETELGVQPVIVSLSLGATRTFRLRHKTKDHRIALDLQQGSLLRMAGLTQKYWTHAVLKEKTRCGARINLTFRRING